MADDFLTTYAPLANDIATATKLDPSVVLGIIDTETGHGQHVLGNNIFGISPGGRVAQYPDVQTGSHAFVSLMQTPRYASVAAAPDPASQAAALVKSGYNTVNPKYAATVAANAQNAAKVLGYEDNAPATEKDKALADPALQTAQQPEATTTPSASTDKAPSEKDKALADPALQVTTKPPPDDFGTFSPEGVYVPPGAIPAKGAPVASLEDLRDRIQQGEINALKWMAPDKDAGPIERGLRYAAMTGTHLAAGIAQAPLNALVFAEQGGPGPGGLTYNPQTGAMNLTPEAMAAASLGANPLRFGGPLKPQFGPWAAPEQFGPPAPEPYGPPKAPTPAFVPPNTSNVPLPPRAAPTDTRPAMIPPNTTVDPVTGEVTPVQQPPTAAGGGPQPGGAQVTPSYEAIHTPAEEAAYRATAEGKKLIEGQKIGEPDLNQYIPGETANNAEREQTAKAARELKGLGIRVPEASQLDKEAVESNNTARVVYAENTAKGRVEITNRRTQRETDIKADKAQVFAPDNVTGPVDFAPVIKQMEAVLKEPENRQNSALQSVYREQLERIKVANIEDPAEAWGLRRDLDRLTDKRMAAKDPNLHYVAHHLDDVANLIDSQIENVAPGYSDMLARYKEHSRAISEMEVLQGALKNLRGPGQKMTYNDFQRFMKNVVDSRMTPSTDLNAFKTISEENMQRLWNIRDSLRRTASAKELASAAGSDTMPNIIDALKGIGKMGGTAALHAYVGAHLGPGGNLALQSLGALGKSLNDRRTIRRATEQMNQLLRPAAPLRTPPGQENPLTGAPPP